MSSCPSRLRKGEFKGTQPTDSVVEAFLEKGERVKADERRAGISGRFTTGTLIVMPGRRTESFASGIIGMVAVAAKPMMYEELLTQVEVLKMYSGLESHRGYK
jgi:hypothetical protein